MKQGEWGKEQARVPHGVSLWWKGIMERPML